MKRCERKARSNVLRVFTALLLAAFAAACLADDYPSRPVRLIVPFAAGSTSDTVARLLAESLRDSWGEPVVVLNKPGADGTLGTSEVTRATADGYTLLIASSSLVLDRALHDKLPYDPEKDLRPIALLGVAPLILATRPSAPGTDLKAFIVRARDNPGKLSYGSPGAGTLSHLMMEVLKSEAHIDMVHVVYKGTPRLLSDLIGGHIDATFAIAPAVLPLIKAGQIRALAITSARRSEEAPDVPTFAEQGLEQFEASAWMGLLVPVGTPDDVVRKLSVDVQRAVRSPRVTSGLAHTGFQVVGGTPEEFGRFMHSEMVRWSKVVKTNGIRAEAADPTTARQ
jgi:tripartite-type tricarboxylate transporter receptor subunit TctC